VKFAHKHQICVSICYNYFDAVSCQTMHVVDIRSHKLTLNLVCLLFYTSLAGINHIVDFRTESPGLPNRTNNTVIMVIMVT